MHVMVIAHTRHPISQPFAGGLESLTWHLVHGLVDRGHRVSVFAARGTEPIPGVEHLWPDELTLSPAAQADVSMPGEGWMQRHHAYLRLMLALAARRDIDVVNSHSLHHLPVAMAPGLPTPTVLTLHTPPTPWLESALTVVRAAGGRPVHTSAVSSYTAGAWSHLTRARVIPNGVDTDWWRPGPGGDRLVWSGRLVPEKAPHLAVRIARAAGLGLVLAGPIADRAYARQQVLPLCGEDVEYAGHLRGPELAELIGSSAAALVTPAWDEPYGLAAAEALACGTPILALDRGGLPEVVGPEVGRLVPVRDGARPLSEDQVVARAAALLPQVLDRPRAACRRYAVQHHSLDRMVDGYVQLYEEAAGVRPGGPGEPPTGRVLRRLPQQVRGVA
jgi:glycosyltransferase involved in cell wall biosynthesis